MDGSTSREELLAEIEHVKAERDGLASQLEGRKGGTGSPHFGMRRALSIGFAVLACIAIVAASIAWWTSRTLLDTDEWVATAAPIVEDPSVTEAMSRRITEQLFIAIDAPALLEDALPPRASVLATPLSNAVEGFMRDQVRSLLQTQEFVTIWTEANRFAHTQIVAVLREEEDGVLTAQDGRVVLNLLPAVNAALAQIETEASGLLGRDVTLPTIGGGELPEVARTKIEDALNVSLPTDFGEITLVQSDQLEEAQDAVQTFDRSVLALLILAPILVALALWISPKRRRTLIAIAVGSMLGLVIVRRLSMWGSNEVVAAAKPENRAAARAIIDQLGAGLFTLTAALIVIGLITVIAAVITAPYPWAGRLRRRTVEGAGALRTWAQDEATVTWVARHRELLQLSGVGLALVVLLVFNLSLVGLLLVLALLAIVWRAGQSATMSETSGTGGGPTPAPG